MADENEFEPRLGRMRARGPKQARKFLHRVLAAAVLAKGGAGHAGPGRFSGSRIGRGAGVGSVLGGRDRFAAFRQRRVVVKSRIAKLAGKGLAGAGAHLRYIQRDGVTREGDPGQLYDAETDSADGRAFHARIDGDRHQFRFIVSAEDGAEYDDLKPLTRRLMARMEEDLGTRLDWVAVDHFNTGHPHTHIILRGRDDRDRDLVIARDYMTQGMRERAAELIQLDLGPRTDAEIESRLRAEVEQERLTSIDRRLLRDRDAEGAVGLAARDAFQQSLQAGRLQKLVRLGLAEPSGVGLWRLSHDLEATLRAMGERGDILKTLHRELRARDVPRSAGDRVIFNSTPDALPITGRVVVRGLSDEIADRHYVIVDGVDGRAHYVDIGRGDTQDMIPEGAIVRVSVRGAGIRQVDRTVAAIAAAHDGRYNVDLHLRHDPHATEEFAQAHVRRLEAIQRLTGGAKRDPSGTWIIAPDHLERAGAHEVRIARDRPVSIETLSPVPLDRLPTHDGATWLDRELVSSSREPLRETGFGGEVRAAQALRRQWLLGQELAEQTDGGIRYRAGMVAILQRRELLRVAGQLSEDLAMKFVEPVSGTRVEGVLRRHLDTPGGRLAVIERAKDFTLVPWRRSLADRIGKPVSGIMHADGVSWHLGRRRGPEIS